MIVVAVTSDRRGEGKTTEAVRIFQGTPKSLLVVRSGLMRSDVVYRYHVLKRDARRILTLDEVRHGALHGRIRPGTVVIYDIE